MGKTDSAYDYIKERIINGVYPPLSDLSEDKLQEELNVSRTPVREAILRLEKEDFVYVYPRKGTIVTDVTHDLIEDVYEIRELIEPRMVASTMHLVKRDWLLDIRKRFLEPPEELEGEELRQYFIQLDTELHTNIMDGCPNRYMRRLMKNIYDQNQRLRMACSNPDGEDDRTVIEHVQIVDAVLNKDKKRLEEVLITHLEESKRRTIQTFR
ncbi:MAG: GntR family transcriptional regulator [Clostridium sp.]|nr:GntR family transcriptional regulator [Clostridium sp.]